MEPHHRDIIKSNIQDLLEKIDYDSISPQLVERGLFTRAMFEDIEEPSSKKEKLLMLLQELPTRGPEAFGKFVDLLMDKEQVEAANILHPVVNGENTLEILDARNNNTFLERVRIQEPSTDEITVRKATILRTGETIYKMTSKPRGLCLIINNVNFSDGPRNGSDVDQTRADKTFLQLGFKVNILRNLNCKDMFEELKRFSQRREHADLDSMIVTIMTHGFKEVVFGVDYKPLSITAIYNLFNNEVCPGLRGKPKMFFLQSCRGEKTDYGVRENVTADAQTVPQPLDVAPNQDATLPEFRTLEDIIIFYSSAPEHLSFRNETSGSWFISALTYVFIHNACDHHLIDMINKVDRRIEKRVGMQGQRQTTSYMNIGFNKNLYFNPGW